LLHRGRRSHMVQSPFHDQLFLLPRPLCHYIARRAS
jgi:hypothetical protein